MTSRNPYSGTTFHPKRNWCGATGSFVTSDGREINLICTRFKDHLTKGKDPLLHFDEVKRRSWHDDDPQPCEPPAE